MEKLQTPEPHYIPGYAGYCPQFIYRVGDTYGSQTHKLIIDPCISHAEKLVLSDRSYDDYHVKRPTLREIDLVDSHGLYDGDAIYKHPMTPGYEGFVPRINGQFGQRFSVSATEGLANFQQDLLRNKRAANRLKHLSAKQRKPECTRSLGDRSVSEKDYIHSINDVRPDYHGCVNVLPKEKLPVPPPLPYSKETPPHFMKNDNPEKYLKLGYGGHEPFAWPRFGQGNKPLTNSALCDFTNNYQHRRSTEWAPIINVGNYSRPSQTTGQLQEIYHKNIGLIPNYAGHVPGAIYRFGHTYGNDSRDAKRWLRGDFST